MVCQYIQISKGVHSHIYKELFCTVLLAATSQNRCTALVCSCYAPSRSTFNTNRSSSNNNSGKKDDGLMEECGNNESQGQGSSQDISIDININGCSNANGTSTSSGFIQRTTLKSNLKKSTTSTTTAAIMELGINQVKTDQRRKVTWPDHALGKDIAHVQEFEPSVSEDGELNEGVRKSCLCAIQ